MVRSTTLYCSDTFLYADDTVIVCKDKDHTEVNDKLAIQLDKAQTWLRNHKLSLNLTKTKVMYPGMINKTNKEQHSTLSTGHGKIEVVTKFKYLGIMVDSNLTFKSHVDYLLQKVFSKTKDTGENQMLHWGGHCFVFI